MGRNVFSLLSKMVNRSPKKVMVSENRNFSFKTRKNPKCHQLSAAKPAKHEHLCMDFTNHLQKHEEIKHGGFNKNANMSKYENIHTYIFTKKCSFICKVFQQFHCFEAVQHPSGQYLFVLAALKQVQLVLERQREHVVVRRRVETTGNYNSHGAELWQGGCGFRECMCVKARRVCFL